MVGLSDLLWGGFFPAAVAATALALVWRFTHKAASSWRSAIVLGYVAGHWGLDARDIAVTAMAYSPHAAELSPNWILDPRNLDWTAALTKSFRPAEARDWIPAFLLLAALPDAIACVGKWGPAFGWILRIGLCLFLPWRFLRGSRYMPLLLSDDFGFAIEGSWSTGEACAWISGIAAILLLGWFALLMVHEEQEVKTRSLLAILVAFGGAATVGLSDSLLYAQLLGVMTATLAGAALASVLMSAKRSAEAAAGPVIVTFGSVLILSYFYAALKTHNALLLLTAMAFAVGWLPLPSKLGSHWCILGRCVVCFAVLIAAVMLAYNDFLETQAEIESNPYLSALF